MSVKSMENMKVNTITNSGAVYAVEEQMTATAWSEGQIVEGTITNVSDMVSITFNEKEIEVSSTTIQNAKEGQVRRFEITDVSNNGIVLREIGNSADEVSNGVKTTTVAVNINIPESMTAQVNTTKQETVDEVGQQVRRTQLRFTELDYEELSKEGDALDEYNATRLDRAIDRIKTQRALKERHLQNQVEKKKEKREQIEESTVRSCTDSSKDAKEMEEQLERANLPVTQENVMQLSTAMELASMAASMTDQSKAYLINNQLSLSPENIYKARYSGSGETDSTINNDAWNELQSKVEDLLQREGFDVTEETMQEAKWLLSYELPLTKENLTALEAMNGFQKEYSESDIMASCLRAMQQGKDPRKTGLGEMEQEQQAIERAVETMELLASIPDGVEECLVDGSTVTLESLAQITDVPASGGELSIAQIRAKRQLEEIRLKLTLESSYQLHKQGIQVNTTELEELVTQLKELEQSYCRTVFEDAGVTPSEEQVNELWQVSVAFEELKYMPNTVLGSTYAKRTQITPNELHEAGQKELMSQQNKAQDYEMLMTAPRKDMGDSIQKAFESVDSILEDLGLEQTESNQRAVRILAYNNMELTKENITSMKSYDAQVNDLLTSMRPEVTVELIRDGIHPLEMSVNDLTEKAREIAKEMEPTSEERFSEYLYKLDQKKMLSTEERNSYIGIYRLLHQIETSDGAAVGMVVKAEQELTLNNLLTAVRTRKQEGYEVSVDDTFGETQSIATDSKSISEQINQAYYGRQMASQAYRDLSAEAMLSGEMGPLEQVMEMSLERFGEQLKQLEEQVSGGSSEEYEAIQQAYENMYEAKVLAGNRIEVTANSLEAAHYIMEEGSAFYTDLMKHVKVAETASEETLKEKLQQFEEALGDAEAFANAANEVEEILDDAFIARMGEEDLSIEEAKKMKLLRTGIQLVGEMGQHQLYEVPVSVGDKLVNMKVQLVPAHRGEVKLELRMEEEEWGTFEASISVEEGSVSGFLLCSHRELLEHVEKNKESIKEEIHSLGLDVKQWNCSMNQKHKKFYEVEPEKQAGDSTVSTSTLYEVAKTIVSYVKQYEA